MHPILKRRIMHISIRAKSFGNYMDRNPYVIGRAGDFIISNLINSSPVNFTTFIISLISPKCNVHNIALYMPISHSVYFFWFLNLISNMERLSLCSFAEIGKTI